MTLAPQQKLDPARDAALSEIWKRASGSLDGGAAILTPSGSWSRSRYPGATLLPACSLTKLMTAQIVLQLAQEKRLRLSTTAREILPWLPAWTGGVTLEHLLTHTSGLRNMNESMGKDASGLSKIYLASSPELRDLRRRLLFCLGSKPASPPGKSFDYNNLDFLVVQAVIERVESRDYCASLAARVLRPARMTRTKLAPWGRLPKEVAPCWRLVAGKRATESRINFGIYGAAAGALTTLEDVQRWVLWSLAAGASASPLLSGSRFGGFQGYGCYAYNSDLFGPMQPIVERPGACGYYQWQVTILPKSKSAAIAFSVNDGAKLGSAFEKSGACVELLKAASQPGNASRSGGDSPI